MSRLGGITYGRMTEGIEIPRPDFQRDLGGQEGYDKLVREQEKQPAGEAPAKGGGDT